MHDPYVLSSAKAEEDRIIPEETIREDEPRVTSGHGPRDRGPR